MNINEFIEKTTIGSPRSGDFIMRPQIICNDGFKMSVQGYSGHYCTPRKISDFYISMEIGFPSEEEQLLTEFAEQEDRPTETVYGYVPTEIIDQVIEKHGGINELETFKIK